MKSPIKPLFLLPLLLLHGAAIADDDIPLLRPEERAAVEAQTDDFNRALTPVLAEASRSTVRVWSGKKRLAYGTVIGDGRRVLTKWSEVAAAVKLRVEGPGGEVLPATIAGVYQDDDIAVLETTGTPLAPVKWSMEPPVIGAFLAAPQPNGKPASFGVVSVAERNLRETDSAFLGVVGDMDFTGPGVRIGQVMRQSGAEAAGLKRGQIILEVAGRSISGLMELRNSLVGRQPGESVTVRIDDGGDKRDLEVKLGNRPELPSFPGDRLRAMESMGSQNSRVRDSFTRVLQSDMYLLPNQIGGPVVDLKGRVIGITVARADRTRSFVMPASAVSKLLETQPIDPSLAKVREVPEEQPMRVARRRMVPPPQGPGAEERMRRHLTEMQQLMDFMLQEMDSLEQGR